MEQNKEIIKALESIGFQHTESRYWSYKGYKIKIYPNTTLAEVFTQVLECGSNLKVWEIKDVLHIID